MVESSTEEDERGLFRIVHARSAIPNQEEEEEYIAQICRRYSNPPSGCASRRIFLRNDELIPLPPKSQTHVPTECSLPAPHGGASVIQ